MGGDKLKPKDIGKGMGLTWSEDYYKTPLKSTDWKGQISGDWKPYEPSKVSTGWSIDPGAKQTSYDPMQGDVMSKMSALMKGEAYAPGNVMKTSYDPMQGDVMSRLGQLMKGGAYTAEGKQKMIAGAMTPVQEMAQQMKQQAAEGAYARGLGQSGVLQRSEGLIDKATLARMAEVTGSVELAAAENSSRVAMDAIQAYQQGQASERDVNLSIERLKFDAHSEAARTALDALAAYQTGRMSEQDFNLSVERLKLENAQTNAQYAQEYESLKAQINLDDRKMQIMLAELEQAAYATDADREIAEMQIRNNYNLSVDQLILARDVARVQGKQKGIQIAINVIGAVEGTIGGKEKK